MNWEGHVYRIKYKVKYMGRVINFLKNLKSRIGCGNGIESEAQK